MDRPSRVDGILELADGISERKYRCKKCGDGLFAIVGLFGAEICRNCAMLFATDESMEGHTFHCYDIIWRDDCDWYSICPTKVHPPDEKCELCPTEEAK